MGQEDSIIRQLAAELNMTNGAARKNFTLDPFTFVINYLPLAASNTATNNFITQADSGFAICKTAATYASDVNAYVGNLSDTPKYAPFIITLSDSGSGRDLSNAPVSINTYFGTGQEPFIWSTPKILDPNSTFSARIQNLAATDYNIRLSFHGYKIFGDITAFKRRRQ